MNEQDKEIAELRQAIRGLTILVAELTGRLIANGTMTKENAAWAVNQASPRLGHDRDIVETWDEVWRRNLR